MGRSKRRVLEASMFTLRKPTLQRWSLISAAPFLTLVAICIGSGLTSHPDDLPIGFTRVPFEYFHGGDTRERVCIRNLNQRAEVCPFRFEGLLSDPKYGTGFVGWLRDGRAMINIVRGTFDNEIVIVDMKKRRIVDGPSGRPTACVRDGSCTDDRPRPNIADFQAVYDPQHPTKLLEYVFFATAENSVLGQVWTVDPMGKPFSEPGKPTTEPPKPTVDDEDGHGCNISPNGKFLACHIRPGDDRECTSGIRIEIAVKGQTAAQGPCVLPRDDSAVKAVECMYTYTAIWSPDSNGLVYYSQSRENYQNCNEDSGVMNGTHSENAWIVYVHFKKDPKTSRLDVDKQFSLTKNFNRLVEHNWTPGYFCINATPRHNPVDGGFSPCVSLGKDWLGTDLMAWSPKPDHLQLYFSAFDRKTRLSGANINTMGAVRIDVAEDQVTTFEPLKPDYGTPSGFPAVSPSGKQIVFLCADSVTDIRAQVCVFDLKNKKWSRITSITKGYQAFNPRWKPGSLTQD